MEDTVQNNKSLQRTEITNLVQKLADRFLKHWCVKAQLFWTDYIFKSVRDTIKWRQKSDGF